MPPSRHRLQEERSLYLRVATHSFVENGDCGVMVVEDGLSPARVELFSFAGSTALRDLFLQRLRDGPRDGDDRRLTPMPWPCFVELREMLSRPIIMPLPPGMLVALVKHVKEGHVHTLQEGLVIVVVPLPRNVLLLSAGESLSPLL